MSIVPKDSPNIGSLAAVWKGAKSDTDFGSFSGAENAVLK